MHGISVRSTQNQCGPTPLYRSPSLACSSLCGLMWRRVHSPIFLMSADSTPTQYITLASRENESVYLQIFQDFEGILSMTLHPSQGWTLAALADKGRAGQPGSRGRFRRRQPCAAGHRNARWLGRQHLWRRDRCCAHQVEIRLSGHAPPRPIQPLSPRTVTRSLSHPRGPIYGLDLECPYFPD